MLTARDLAERLNLKRHPRSWRGACPACSYPSVFSVRAGRQGNALAYCANGCTRDDLAGILAAMRGGDPPVRPPSDDTAANARARKQAAALRLW